MGLKKFSGIELYCGQIPASIAVDMVRFPRVLIKIVLQLSMGGRRFRNTAYAAGQ